MRQAAEDLFAFVRVVGKPAVHLVHSRLQASDLTKPPIVIMRVVVVVVVGGSKYLMRMALGGKKGSKYLLRRYLDPLG